MERVSCMVERLAGLVVAAALFVVGFFFIVLGLTFLPAIGIIIAIPIMGMSLYFVNLRVEIGTVDKPVADLAADMGGSACCAWPRVLEENRELSTY